MEFKKSKNYKIYKRNRREINRKVKEYVFLIRVFLRHCLTPDVDGVYITYLNNAGDSIYYQWKGINNVPVDMLAVVECLENQDWIIEDHMYEEKIHAWGNGKNETLRRNGIFYIPLNNSNIRNKALTVSMEDVCNKAWDYIST